MLTNNKFNILRSDHLFIGIFSILPLFFLLGPAINNSFSVIFAIYGIFIIFIKKKFNLIFNSYSLYFLIFILVLFLSSLIFSENLNKSIISSLLYAPFFFYFVAGIFIFSQFEQKNYILLYRSLLFVVFILALITLYDALFSLFNINNNKYGNFYNSFHEGFKSLFSNKILGVFLIKVFPLIIGLSLMIYKKINYLTLTLLGILAFMIFLSYHRTSIFLFIFMNILIFSIFIEYRRPFIKLILLLMPVLFILFSTFPDSFDNLIKKTKDQLIQEKGIQIFPNHYLGHFYTTFKIIKLNPLTGAGTDSFDYNCYNDKYVSFYDSYYDMNNKKVWLNSCSTHPHNFYLQIFSENGILAFLMFVFFYISLIRELISSRKKSYGNTQIFYELCLVSAICCYFPFAPSLSFYNTYLNSISYFPIIFIIFHNLRYKHKIL